MIPLRILKNFFGLISQPAYCTYLITFRCNARCQMCQVWQKENIQPELTLAEIKKIFQQLKLDAIAIKGGEPFLRKDLAEVINLIQKASQPKVIHLTSNGLWTEPLISFFEKIKKPTNIHLKISLDAVGQKHDQIRGVPKAFQRVIKTLEVLVKLRKKYHFYLGVNQTIVDQESLEEHQKLKEILEPLKINIYTAAAYSSSALYAASPNLNLIPVCAAEYKWLGQFPPEQLERFFQILFEEVKQIDNWPERIARHYYLRGLYNRLVLKKAKPNPPCLALKDHLRILPNGDVPICLFNSQVVGNLKEKTIKQIWSSPAVTQARQLIKKCPGCWAGCEITPNAIYSGDIIKELWK